MKTLIIVLVPFITGAFACAERQVGVQGGEVPDAGAYEEGVTFMFVQEAAGGTLQSNADGTYLLTLNGISPAMTYFSDRPATISGTVPIDEFIAKFTWGVFGDESAPPPNAAIALKEPASETQDTLVVEMTDPHYDKAGGTLTYAVKPLNADAYAPRSGQFTSLLGNADATLPYSFGLVSVFIDSCPRCTATCYGGYIIYLSRACRGEIGNVGKKPCCWSWQHFWCKPCHDYLAECMAGTCRCSGSCMDPDHPGWTECDTSKACFGEDINP